MGRDQTMKFIDLFAGIGGFRLAMEEAGHECVGFCEIDKFARESYKNINGLTGSNKYKEWEWHDIRKWSNKSIRKFKRRRGYVDAIVGGFPCQAFSIAGKRGGFNDTRGTLFFEIARIASILKPRYLLLENVKGLLSHDHGNTFETILRTLDELGYDAEWNVFNSKLYVPQNRERIFIIGHLRGGGTRNIFPFSENGRSLTSKSIQKLGNIRMMGKPQSGDVVSVDGLAPTLCSTTTQKDPLKVVVAGNLPGNHEQNSRVYSAEGLSPTLTTMQGGGQEPKIIQKARGHNKGGMHEIAPTLTSHSYHENNLVKEVSGIYTNDSPSFNRGPLPGLSRTIKSNNHDAGVTDGFRIRKLTPRECWRLQGFPEWAFNKAAKVTSNSQLYKQAGNSVTVPVVFEIAKRL